MKLPLAIYNSQTNYNFSPTLCNALIAIIKHKKIRRLYDFGCGGAKYVLEFKKLRKFMAWGIDINPKVKEFAPFTSVADLRLEQRMQPVEMVIAINVFQYIEGRYEKQFLKNVADNATVCIVITGEEGKDPFIIQMLEFYGHKYNKKATKWIRKQVENTEYGDHLMVFFK